MITLTDNATVKVGQLLAAEGAEELALRVAVRPGGCSGFSYEMFFDGDIASDEMSPTSATTARSASWSTRPRHSCSKAPPSTTRTGWTKAASP